MNEKKCCHKFLIANGWEHQINEEYDSYTKGELVAIDFAKNHMVFVDGNGDFYHARINYYTLIGVLLEYRQITIGYVSIKNKTN
jgi:hypothetical protein